MTLHDPAVVRTEYEHESRLAARKAAYAGAEGTDARDVLFEAIAEAQPRKILEVGCGEGELAERLRLELGAEVTAIDQSARMVELTRKRGVDARVGTAEQLEFADESLDCVVAAWTLYHVRELDRALAEMAGVLTRAGRLVAVTNGRDHLKELYELIGPRRISSSFLAEDAEGILRHNFPKVDRRDAHGWLVFPDAVDGPIHLRRLPTVFVAERA